MSDTDTPIPDPTLGRVNATTWGPTTYGDSFADVYDEWYDDLDDADDIADFVSILGSSLKILELGSGTGRLIGPLLVNGHHVVGLDASLTMLSHVRQPDAFDQASAAADMAALPFRDDSFDVVLVATNTLCNVADVQGQQRTITEARRVLRPGGRFITETFVPPANDPSMDRLVATRSITPASAVITASIRDSGSQTITGQHIEFANGSVRLRPWKIRYVHPEELHHMSQKAGFGLDGHFGSWNRAEFNADSTMSISVYLAL